MNNKVGVFQDSDFRFLMATRQIFHMIAIAVCIVVAEKGIGCPCSSNQTSTGGRLNADTENLALAAAAVTCARPGALPGNGAQIIVSDFLRGGRPALLPGDGVELVGLLDKNIRSFLLSRHRARPSIHLPPRNFSGHPITSSYLYQNPSCRPSLRSQSDYVALEPQFFSFGGAACLIQRLTTQHRLT